MPLRNACICEVGDLETDRVQVGETRTLNPIATRVNLGTLSYLPPVVFQPREDRTLGRRVDSDPEGTFRERHDGPHHSHSSQLF